MHDSHVHMKFPAGTSRGYTIAELLAAMTVTVVTLAAAGTLHRGQLFALRQQATQLDVQTAGRNVVELFSRDVRRAGLDPTCAKTFEGIAQARPDLIQLQSDLDGSGAIDRAGESILYAYDFQSACVRRTAGGEAEILATGVNASRSRIRYFDGSGSELLPAGSPPALSPAQRSAVRTVRMELELRGAPADPGGGSAPRAAFSSQVDLRNRFFVRSTACP